MTLTHCKGGTGKPDLPCADAGKPQRADGAGREHATYIVLLESYMLNTGSFSRDGKEGGQ
jgi:hypothetical protein